MSFIKPNPDDFFSIALRISPSSKLWETFSVKKSGVFHFSFKIKKWGEIFKKLETIAKEEAWLRPLLWEWDSAICGPITDKEAWKMNCDYIAAMCQEYGKPYPEELKPQAIG